MLLLSESLSRSFLRSVLETWAELIQNFLELLTVCPTLKNILLKLKADNAPGRVQTEPVDSCV